MGTRAKSMRQDNPGTKRSSYASTGARLFLGLLFLIFGLNGFLQFLPQPKNIPDGALAFSMALMKTHYMFPLIMGTQLLAGVLLVLNRFVPLALALLAPVLVNIIAFHLWLAPSGIIPGAVALVLEIYLAWAYRQAFLPMLAARALSN